MEIQGTEIQLKDYKGKRVVTFKDILITPDESESYKTPIRSNSSYRAQKKCFSYIVAESEQKCNEKDFRSMD